MSHMLSPVADEHRAQFLRDGFFVLGNAIPPSTLQMLQEELAAGIARSDAEMDAAGTDSVGISHRGKRYFIANTAQDRPRLREFLFSDLTADICRSTLGDDAWLFYEQYVVKFGEVGLKFAWHQDSGYLKSHLPDYIKPYVSLWCALDDMTEENGTIYVLPYARSGAEVVDHVAEAGSNDLVGYFGDDPGDPIVVPAGSIVVFSSTVMHRSGFNHTARPRRSYLAQYSAERIMNPTTAAPFALAEPFLEAGSRVDR